MNPLYTAPPPEAVQFNVASSATSNIDADYDEVYAYSYIKRSCESFIGSMDKPGRVRVNVLTSNFKFDGWWKSLPAYFSKNGSILNVLQSEIEEVVPITMPSAGTASTNYKVTYMYVPVLNSDGTPVREDIAVHRLRGGIGITEKVEVDKTEKKYYIRYVDSEGRWAAGSSWVEFTPTDDDKKRLTLQNTINQIFCMQVHLFLKQQHYLEELLQVYCQLIDLVNRVVENLHYIN